MNAEKCLQILREIKDVAFATVDENGCPQIRIIDIMIAEGEKVYFCTARGKDFFQQLIKNGQIAVTGMNRAYQMIRLNGKARRLDEQKMWIDRIFEENPSMNDVYPGDSRYVLEAFCVDNGEVEFFDLGQTPIERVSFRLGNRDEEKHEDKENKETGTAAETDGTDETKSSLGKGFEISDTCIQCGKCERICPQQCIQNFTIQQNHCLHCGLCMEECPVSAVVRREEAR